LNKEYARLQTDAKRIFHGFATRELHPPGMRIRYAVGGDGPPVVLVHGLGGTIANWRPIAEALTAEHRVVVPDLPGHGGSAAPADGGLGLDALAGAVLAVLEAEAALPAVWIGHSLGGTVGLRAAATRPEVLRGLVLAGAAGISSGTRAAEATLTVLGVVQPGRLVAPFRRRMSRSRLGRRIVFGWWGVADPAGLAPERAEDFLSGPAEHTDTASAGRALLASDLRPDLARVRCPCLCLWGANDNWVPLADGMEYARRLRAPLRAIAGCGHLLIGERPDACLAAIRGFVAGLPD
jgi:pimeloyl-ACP methyl ester carboxylesterase